MAAQFVWINGLPGLIDNHSLLDQVSLPRTQASYNAERARVRDATYSSSLYPRDDDDDDDDAQLARVVIFTEWAWANHGTPVFLPVYLTCERGENLRRVVRPERGAAGSSKLTDAALVESFMEDSHFYRFPGLGVEIDTTARGPEETAPLILDAMKAQVEELRA
ncbi:hypothetical protein ARSEF4850_000868 [Beauveria asiatica]